MEVSGDQSALAALFQAMLTSLTLGGPFLQRAFLGVLPCILTFLVLAVRLLAHASSWLLPPVFVSGHNVWLFSACHGFFLLAPEVFSSGSVSGLRGHSWRACFNVSVTAFGLSVCSAGLCLFVSGWELFCLGAQQ